MIEDDGYRRPLPARLLYSGFRLSEKRTDEKKKKKRLNRSPFRSSFFGSPVHWEKGFLWLSEAAPLPVWFISGQPRGVFKTIQDHIIFGKKIYQDLKLWVRRLWGDGGSSCQCQSGAKYLLASFWAHFFPLKYEERKNMTRLFRSWLSQLMEQSVIHLSVTLPVVRFQW